MTNVSKNDENIVFFSFFLFFLEKNKIKMADYSKKTKIFFNNNQINLIR